MSAEKDAAIKEWTAQLKEEFDAKERTLVDKVTQVNSLFEETKRQLASKEAAWQAKCNLLAEQNKKTQASNAADFEHYQARVRTLEEEVTLLKHQAPAAEKSVSECDPSLLEMKATIAKRNAEISFLKDTVRLECEERIQLIAKLAVYTQNGTMVPAAVLASPMPRRPASVNELPRGNQALDSHLSNSRESSAPLKKSFESMMHDSAAKKEKKLAKSSSRKKLYGY